MPTCCCFWKKTAHKLSAVLRTVVLLACLYSLIIVITHCTCTQYTTKEGQESQKCVGQDHQPVCTSWLQPLTQLQQGWKKSNSLAQSTRVNKPRAQQPSAANMVDWFVLVHPRHWVYFVTTEIMLLGKAQLLWYLKSSCSYPPLTLVNNKHSNFPCSCCAAHLLKSHIWTYFVKYCETGNGQSEEESNPKWKVPHSPKWAHRNTAIDSLCNSASRQERCIKCNQSSAWSQLAEFTYESLLSASSSNCQSFLLGRYINQISLLNNVWLTWKGGCVWLYGQMSCIYLFFVGPGWLIPAQVFDGLNILCHTVHRVVQYPEIAPFFFSFFVVCTLRFKLLKQWEQFVETHLQYAVLKVSSILYST